MKPTWQTKKLVDICDIFADGDWIEKKDQSDCGVRLIQTGNIGLGCFKDRGEKARYISNETFMRLRCSEVMVGDCLVSRLPEPVGRSCIIPETGEKMITAVDCTILRFNNEVISQWFTYFSLSPQYKNQINKLISGATRQRISRNNLGLTNIPLPPIADQRRIIKLLDEAFESIDRARAAAEKNLQNSKAVFTTVLNKIFSNNGDNWLTSQIDKVCSIQYGYTDKARNNGKFRFVRITDTNSKGLLTSDNKMYVDSFADSGKYLLQDGDLLMARTGASAGNLLYFESKEPSIFASYLIRIRFESEIESKLYWYFSKSQVYWDQVRKLSAGSAQPQFNGGALKRIYFNYPKTISEQRGIVSKLDLLSKQIENLESTYHQKITALEELKKSVLNKAFIGEL